MSVSDVLRTHILYNAWASRRLIEAAGKLSPEELSRDFGTADRSVLGTLVHIFAADRTWLARMKKEPLPVFVTDADRHWSVLQTEWPALLERWCDWAAGLSDGDAATELDYPDLRGNRWRQPAWQLAFHVVNHATHHRGQVAGFLRSMGYAPPPLDLTVYYRSIGSS
ncbi:MAG: DinB family protein [Bryobacteraceae bacterium]